MSHDVIRSTLGETLDRLDLYGRAAGTYSLTVVLDDAGDYSSMFNFGSETPGSDMVAGSSLGYADNLAEVLAKMVAECRA